MLCFALKITSGRMNSLGRHGVRLHVGDGFFNLLNDDAELHFVVQFNIFAFCYSNKFHPMRNDLGNKP